MSRTIDLTRGLKAIVDDEDYDALIAWKWCAKKCGHRWYAVRRLKSAEAGSVKQGQVRMHRWILGNVPAGMDIDHVNGNSLDNRRCNLRVATRSQNMMNTGKLTRNGKSASQFKGVWWNSKSQKWSSIIRIHGVRVYLGLFDTEELAAEAYACAAQTFHGEFIHESLTPRQQKGNCP